MIVVDTSALIAIVLGEEKGKACLACLSNAPRLLISAGTMAETFIVAGQKGKAASLAELFAVSPLQVEAVSLSTARFVRDAHARWGKGNHPARLNFGDCFAYALAKEQSCPLLFIGDDFARTDIVSALQP